MDVDVEVVDVVEGMSMPMWMGTPTYLLLDVMLLVVIVSADHTTPSMTMGVTDQEG
jgi:hypothetical protein